MGSRDPRRVSRWAGVACGALLAASSCKPSRSPREMAAENVSGRWAATMRAPRGEADTTSRRWSLTLQQHEGGRMTGSGRVSAADGVRELSLRGRRDSHRIVLELSLGGEEAAIVGVVEDADRITASLELPRDTIPLTFTRQ